MNSLLRDYFSMNSPTGEEYSVHSIEEIVNCGVDWMLNPRGVVSGGLLSYFQESILKVIQEMGYKISKTIAAA